MTYRWSVLAAILGITSACNLDAPRKAERTVVVHVPRTSGIRPDIAEPEQCMAIGGWWTKVDSDEREGCVLSPTDSGRSCRDDSECQSAFCVAPPDSRAGADAVAGECSSGLIGRCKRLHIKQGRAVVDCIE
jgi:hypothetical protein